MLSCTSVNHRTDHQSRGISHNGKLLDKKQKEALKCTVTVATRQDVVTEESDSLQHPVLTFCRPRLPLTHSPGCWGHSRGCAGGRTGKGGGAKTQQGSANGTLGCSHADCSTLCLSDDKTSYAVPEASQDRGPSRLPRCRGWCSVILLATNSCDTCPRKGGRSFQEWQQGVPECVPERQGTLKVRPTAAQHSPGDGSWAPPGQRSLHGAQLPLQAPGAGTSLQVPEGPGIGGAGGRGQDMVCEEGTPDVLRP